MEIDEERNWPSLSFSPRKEKRRVELYSTMSLRRHRRRDTNGSLPTLCRRGKGERGRNRLPFSFITGSLHYPHRRVEREGGFHRGNRLALVAVLRKGRGQPVFILSIGGCSSPSPTGRKRKEEREKKGKG